MATVMSEMLQDALHEFVASHNAQDFIPLAYYDKHLDCVRVQIRDCSYTELRLGKVFTILQANHCETTDFVGFTIKGVRHFVETLGLPSTEPVKLATFLDAIVKHDPEICTEFLEMQFGKVLHDEISVDDLEYAFA